jgi:glutamate 5-kinase
MTGHTGSKPRHRGTIVRVVVKVGSSSLLDADGAPEPAAVWQLAMQLRYAMTAGHQAVLVSSGAVAVGEALLGGSGASREARAAVGQAHLIGLYREFLGARMVAQVLVLKPDLTGPGDVGLRQTLEDLLAAGILPIVNENDVVSRPHTAVGENDAVAAAIARLIGADLLLLLSDVEGVYDPDGVPPTLIAELDPDGARRLLAAGTDGVVARSSRWGRGGMRTKLQAAVEASLAGIPTRIARARRPRVVLEAVEGMPVGTLVRPLSVAPAATAFRGEEDWYGG